MIKLKLHSMIDVITNSSTEIYTFANSDAVEKCFELLNEVLRISGSDKKAEDLFNVFIRPNTDGIADWFYGKCEEDIDGFEIKDDEKKILKKYFEIEGYKSKLEYFHENVETIILNNKLWKDIYRLEKSVCIEAKDKSISDKDIWKMFFSTFYQDACYDG